MSEENSSEEGLTTTIVPKQLERPGGYERLHPALLENETFEGLEDAPIVSKTRDVLKNGLETVEEAYHTMANPDPRKPRAAHLEDWQKTTEQRRQRLSKLIEDVENIAQTHMNSVQESINQTLSETPRASEIRAYFRNMDDGERTGLLERAIKNADHETIGAMVNGPSYLSGLDDAAREAIKDRFLKVNAPKEYRERQAIEKARGIAKQAYIATTGAIVELTPQREIEEYQKRQRKAAARPQLWPKAS